METNELIQALENLKITIANSQELSDKVLEKIKNITSNTAPVENSTIAGVDFEKPLELLKRLTNYK